MAFAHITAGSLTGLADTGWRIKIAEGTLDRAIRVTDTTGSGDAQKATFTASKRWVYTFNGRGWYQTISEDVASDVHSTGNMSSLSGSIVAKVHSASLVRRTHIVDVTSAADAVPITAFDNTGQITHYGSLLASLETTTDTPQDNDVHSSLATLAIPLGSGVTTGSVVVSRDTTRANARLGGTLLYSYNFQYTGTVTTTSTPFGLQAFTASLVLNNGQTVAGSVLLPNLRCDVDYRGGGPVPFQFSGVFNGAVTWS